MKKLLLLAVCMTGIAGVQAQGAADLLNSFKVELNQKQQDEAIGKGLIQLLKTPEFCNEFVNLLKLQLKPELLNRLIQLFEIRIKIEQMTENPDFKAQSLVFVKGVEKIQTEELLKEEIEKIVAELEKECPLVLKQQTLMIELEDVQKGIFEELQTFQLGLVLTKMVQGLEKTL